MLKAFESKKYVSTVRKVAQAEYERFFMKTVFQNLS